MSNPVYQKRVPLDSARREKLAHLARCKGTYRAALALCCSESTVETLASGGGCKPGTTERVAATLDSLEVAS